MTAPREVVITGMGVVSPVGIGKSAFAESIGAGRSGVRNLSLVSGFPFPVPFGGEIPDFDAKQYVTPRKSLKVMCREIQLAFAAASLAITDAGLITADVDHDRFGVMFGSEMFYSDPEELVDAFRACLVHGEFHFSNWGDKAMSRLYPLWMLKYLPNMPACHIAIANDARGPNNTFTLGDVSTLLALQEAARCIERGLADVMIVGGTGSRVNPTNIVFSGVQDRSHRNECPAAACRPFDAGRDGIVIGEGSGAFVVEEAQYAAARGARIAARVLGFSSTVEAPSRGKPCTGRAIRNSILLALRSAQLRPGDIGHVNANGRSTIVDDALEAQAIRDTLGDVPVTAPKSFFGVLGAGTGAVELAVSLLALERGAIPVTLNYETPDPKCPVNVVHGRELPSPRPVALVLNQSTSGQAAAVVLAAP